MANMNFGVNILPKANNTYTLGNSDYKWNIFANTLNDVSLTNIITDVQIDGTSILSNNIANIPIATWNTLGVVKAGAGYGVGMLTGDNLGIISVQKADTSLIKAGANIYKPIVPYNQHEATFYGLAKAAGDSTQSASSNAVGIYTDSAKTAIQSMLGISTKADKTDTVLYTTLSLGRKANTTIGENSIALGSNVEASGDTAYAEGIRTVAEGTGSHAEGSQTVAYGVYSHAEGVLTVAEAAHSHAEGNSTQAHGRYSHAEGYYTNASGLSSHSEGQRTIASGACSHVSGIYNVEDDFSNWSEWTPNTSYVSGDKVKRTVDSAITGYICKTDNSDSTFTLSNWINTSGRMNYAEIIGNGMDDNNRSNARALDWDGNERLKGNIYVGCNADSSSGTKVATLSDIPSTMVGATSSVAGTSGLVPAPATTDVDKFLAGDGTYKSGGLPMVILSYGNSVWQDFIDAYNNNVIVYCRASSNSNPASGSQTRMAFMAYVNNATTPTEVEFQYYRSMSSHSATAMGDQVFVYKLTKTSGWSVTTRDTSIKQIKMATDSAGSVSWSSNVVTLNSGLPKVTASDDGKILKVVNGAWAVVDP